MQEYFLNYFTGDDDFPFFIQYGGHEDDLFMHTHADFSELVIVLSGEALHLVNDERFPIKKGDVFVIHRQTAHAYQNVRNFKICNIMYRTELFSYDSADIAQTPGYHALFFVEPLYTKNANFQSRLFLAPKELAQVSASIEQMIQEYHNSAPGRRTMLTARFTELIVFLSRCYEKISSEKKEDTPVMLLSQTLAYLQQHFREDIRICDLAADASYSTRHFDRLFKELYQTSPRDYITTLRLSYACKLLESSDKRIEDIALESGFDNINYFYRLFKKRLHTTPRSWRSRQLPK